MEFKFMINGAIAGACAGLVLKLLDLLAKWYRRRQQQKDINEMVQHYSQIVQRSASKEKVEPGTMLGAWWRFWREIETYLNHQGLDIKPRDRRLLYRTIGQSAWIIDLLGTLKIGLDATKVINPESILQELRDAIVWIDNQPH